MSKKENENPNINAWRKLRKDWGAIKPITKVIPNKKKNTKEKHKGKEYNNETV